MARKVLMALTAGAIALTATACNTVRGAAADINSAANTVDHAV